jgi:thioredoxin-like negative regulator of GroEL
VINENLGQPRKALSYFIEAGKKNSNNIDIQMKIARNYVDTGQMLRAEQILDAVLKKEPENEGARELLKHCL